MTFFIILLAIIITTVVVSYFTFVSKSVYARRYENLIQLAFIWGIFFCIAFPVSVTIAHIKWHARLQGYAQIQQTINRARQDNDKSGLFAIQAKAAQINSELGKAKYMASIPIISMYYPEELRKFDFIK